MILPKAEKTPNNFSHWRHFYETHTPIVLSMTLVVECVSILGIQNLGDFCLKVTRFKVNFVFFLNGRR